MQNSGQNIIANLLLLLQINEVLDWTFEFVVVYFVLTKQKLIGIIDKGPDKLTEFDEDIFERIVTEITADESEIIQFKLIGGLVIKEKIERKKR